MRTALCLLLLVLGSSLLMAQEAENPQEIRGRRVWFAATDIPEDLENPVTVMVGDEFHPVMLTKRRASTAVGIRGEQVVRLVRRIPDPDKAGEFRVVVLAQAAVAKQVQQALVILIPENDPKTDLRFHSKVQNLGRFRGGDYLFFNLTPTKVAIELAGKKLGAEPGAIAIYDASTIKESTNATVSYHYLDPASNEWQLISASTVVLRPTRREICIFSWNEKTQRINYHGMTFPVEPGGGN